MLLSSRLGLPQVELLDVLLPHRLALVDAGIGQRPPDGVEVIELERFMPGSLLCRWHWSMIR